MDQPQSPPTHFSLTPTGITVPNSLFIPLLVPPLKVFSQDLRPLNLSLNLFQDLQHLQSDTGSTLEGPLVLLLSEVPVGY